ncbi:MAG: isochorismatase family protein [Cardiobacteriaceae bacterium]|nr:isochorismatase family protein [Cardiobacteriaceae bacterium]
MIISLEIDAQKTFTPLCPLELPIEGGELIVAQLNAQAKLADFRVMSKEAHSPSALWICEHAKDMGKPTGLPEADQTWVSHGIVGSYGFELLDGLPDVTAYDFCVWKGIEPSLHPYGACFHDISEKLSTGLLEWLLMRGAKVILVGGLATDFCVKRTVLQLLKHNIGGWQVWVNVGACRGLTEESSQSALEQMEAAGARLFVSAASMALALV